MKKLFTLFFLFLAFVSSAQRKLFHANNYFATQSIPIPIVTNGLVLNLDAGNSSSYLGSGNSWNDLSGSNNGTLSNVTFETSPKALLFDGSTSRVTFSAGITAGDNLTYETWIYRLAGSGVIANLNGWSTGYVHWQFGGNSLQFALNGNTDVYSSFVFNLNTWYQIVVVYSKVNKTTSYYVNGALTNIGSYGSATSITQNPFVIGAWDSNGAGSFSRFFNGKIAVFRAYNTALDASQVQQNYNALKSVFGL
jgi:hypothetical protein